jgi:hypothetical protein
VTASIAAVGFGPVSPHRLLAIEEHDIDVVCMFHLGNNASKFNEKTRRGTCVICAHEVDHGNALGVVMACNYDSFAGRAGKLQKDIRHGQGAYGCLGGKGID